MDRNQFHFSSTREKKNFSSCFSWMRREKLWLVEIVEQTHEQSRVFGFVLLRMMRLLIKCHRSNARELPVCEMWTTMNLIDFSFAWRTHAFALMSKLNSGPKWESDSLEFEFFFSLWLTNERDTYVSAYLGFVLQFSNSNRKWQFALLKWSEIFRSLSRAIWIGEKNVFAVKR